MYPEPEPVAHVPSRMRHISVARPGPPDAMALTEGPVPAPKSGEVLIAVAYAGVNRPDCLQRAGAYPPPPEASPILGLEVAGIVVSCGPGVSQWSPGDRVCALTPGGGYAEFCATPADWCLPPPRGLTLAEAATLPETFFTVWNNVFDRARLVPGETLLVHGGTSGIGITAIQLARAFGAHVIATAGTPEKVAFCTNLGADHAIDYRRQDFVAEVARITGSRGVDVVLDMVGGDYIAKNLRCLAVDGRLAQIAFLQGGKAEIDFRPLMVKRQTIIGSTLRASPHERKAAIARSLRDKVWPLLEQGTVRTFIDTTFPLADAARAHALMESSRHIGKIVLAVREGDRP